MYSHIDMNAQTDGSGVWPLHAVMTVRAFRGIPFQGLSADSSFVSTAKTGACGTRQPFLGRVFALRMGRPGGVDGDDGIKEPFQISGRHRQCTSQMMSSGHYVEGVIMYDFACSHVRQPFRWQSFAHVIPSWTASLS
jgi:hypothetical protein